MSLLLIWEKKTMQSHIGNKVSILYRRLINLLVSSYRRIFRVASLINCFIVEDYICKIASKIMLVSSLEILCEKHIYTLSRSKVRFWQMESFPAFSFRSRDCKIAVTLQKWHVNPSTPAMWRPNWTKPCCVPTFLVDYCFVCF